MTVVVVDDLIVKPVPLTDFRIVANQDVLTAKLIRTDENGAFSLPLPPGNYTIESVAPLNVKGRLLFWKKAVAVKADEISTFRLTEGDTIITTPTAPESALPIKEGTKIRLELAEPISSNRSKVGQAVRLTVKEELVGPNKEVLIARGALAEGRITYAKGAGSFGKKGKLEFSLDSVIAIDNTHVALRSSQAADGKNNAMGGVVGIVLFGPLMGFVKGKNITLQNGTLFDAFIGQDVVIMPNESSKPLPNIVAPVPAISTH